MKRKLFLMQQGTFNHFANPCNVANSTLKKRIEPMRRMQKEHTLNFFSTLQDIAGSRIYSFMDSEDLLHCMFVDYRSCRIAGKIYFLGKTKKAFNAK